jgi:hypothetical protein
VSELRPTDRILAKILASTILVAAVLVGLLIVAVLAGAIVDVIQSIQ